MFRTDPFTTFKYIDGEGRTNFLRYQNTNFPYNVTEVENPYRRTATLKYDSQGFLTNIEKKKGSKRGQS